MISLDGEKLRSLRKARKLTQESMAEFANTTDRYLRDLESGKKSNHGNPVEVGTRGQDHLRSGDGLFRFGHAQRLRARAAGAVRGMRHR